MKLYQIALLLFFAQSCKNTKEHIVLPKQYRLANVIMYLPSLISNDGYLVVNNHYNHEDGTTTSGFALLKQSAKNENARFEIILDIQDTSYYRGFQHALYLTDSLLVYKITGSSDIKEDFVVYDIVAGRVLHSFHGERIAVAKDGFFTSNRDTLFYYDKSSSSIVWEQAGITLIQGVYDDGYILGYNDSNIISIDVLSKDTLWVTSLSSEVSKLGYRSKLGNDLFINTLDGLSILDITNGKVKAIHDDYALTSNIIENENSYFINHSKGNSTNISSIDKLSGDAIWTSQQMSMSFVDPILCDNVIIVPSKYGDFLYVLDVFSGDLVESIEMYNFGVALYNKEFIVYGKHEGGIYMTKTEELIN